MLGSQPEYHNDNVPTLLVLSDLSDPAAVRRLHHERAGWQRDSDIEALDRDHFVLTIYAGGARRLLR